MKQFKYILFSFDGACAPIAKKLIDEGRECFYVQVQSYKDMPKDSFMGKPEDKEMEKRRLEIFDGIIDKYTDDEILKWMPTIPDKENYFIYFDFNTFYEYSEKILEMGFVNGYFPLKEDYELEHDRQSGKEFAKKYIKGVKVAEVQEFNKIDDGIQFLNDNTDKIYALKSNGNNCKTIVPLTNNPEFAKNELIIELNRSKKEWEKGFTLEEKIVDITEVCPQICFYNGIPIYTEIEMETRLLGAGDIGCQTGGNQNMVMRTNFYDKINKLAFPKEVYTEAKKRKGIYLKDCGILLDKKGVPYFSEFAGNRYSWGGIFSELTMGGSVSNYFETLASGKMPYKSKFGVTIAIYNLEPDGELSGFSSQNIPIQWDKKVDKTFYPYAIKLDDTDKESEPIIITVSASDLVIAYNSGSGNSLNEAVSKAYQFTNTVSFNGMYYRPKFDFMSTDYISSIPNRLNFLKRHGLI